MKTCSICHNSKKKSEFNKARHTKDGLCYYCRKCMVSYRKNYRAKNVNKISDYKIKRNIHFKKLVFDHYGWRCNCCPEKLESMLSIDHVNNDGYKDIHPGGGRTCGETLYRRIIKEDYPDAYQVLCMNCNWSKMKNNGICEHKNGK